MTIIFELDQRSGPPGSAKPRRRPLSPRRRRQILGGVGLVVIAAIVAVVLMAYNQVFSPGVPATVLASRSGLLLTSGADVTLDGVTVGRVTSITTDGNQARIGISLDPAQTGYIPANVQASIDAPTVFGPKFLDLVPPANPVAQRVQAGQVIEPTAEPTEINTVFANLVSVLDSVHPAKLSATLGAISTALQGRGAELGTFIDQLNSYLREFNPSLPALGNDLATAPTVANTYAAAAPSLIKSLDNLRVTSGTLVGEQAQFDAFLVDLTGFSGNAQSFLASNERGLNGTLSTLLPTSGLLAEYSPEIPCLLGSFNEINKISITDNIVLNTAIVPGSKPYQYPANLPVVGAATGPSCYGGPLTPATAASWPRVTFNDGTSTFFSKNQNLTLGNPPLAVQLFGPLAGAAETAAKSGAKTGKGK
jgi:phospholipid/cholesterol/gamma-HCH transport system substrate-binding protein